MSGKFSTGWRETDHQNEWVFHPVNYHKWVSNDHLNEYWVLLTFVRLQSPKDVIGDHTPWTHWRWDHLLQSVQLLILACLLLTRPFLALKTQKYNLFQISKIAEINFRNFQNRQNLSKLIFLKIEFRFKHLPGVQVIVSNVLQEACLHEHRHWQNYQSLSLIYHLKILLWE